MLNLNPLRLGHLSRKAAWVGTSKATALVCILASDVFLARRLVKSDFGLYQQGWLLIRTLIPILLLGSNQAVNYFIPPAPDHQKRGYIHAFFRILFLTGLAGVLVCLFFPNFLSRVIGNREASPFLPVFGLYVFLVLPSYLMEPLLIIRKRPRELFAWTLLFSVIFLSIALLWGRSANIRAIFISLCVLAFLKSSITLIRALGVYGPGKWTVFPEHRGKILKFTGVLGMIAFVDVLTVQIDKYIVSHFAGAGRFALYHVGALEIPFIGLLLGSVTAVVMPELATYLSQEKKEQAIDLLHRSMVKLSVFMLPLFFYSMITAGFYIPFLFGEKYRASVLIFCIYLGLLPIRGLNNHPYLIAAGLQKYALYARIIDVSVNFILGICLLRWIGLAGPAVSTLVASYIHKIYQTAIVCRFLKLSPRQVYPWKNLWDIAWRSVLCSLPLLAIILVFGHHIVAVIAGTIVFTGCYFLILSRFPVKINRSPVI